MKTDFESAAQNVQSSIHENLRKHEAELNEAWAQGTSVSPSIAGGAAEGEASATADSSAASDGTSWRSHSASTAKRKNWRVKQTATPSWYKRATLRRTRVQSGAARVARHTPVSLRRPTRFF
jgi:sec-independent protein translocase protein TatB